MVHGLVVIEIMEGIETVLRRKGNCTDEDVSGKQQNNEKQD